MPGTKAVNVRELGRQIDLLGSTRTTELLVEALEQKQVKTDDFSVRDLWEAYLGREALDALHPKRGRFLARQLMEAGPFGVRYADFQNITGQLFFSKINEGYQDPAFVFTQLVPVVPTDIQDMERIPGMARSGDEGEEVGEGNEFPYVGFSEDYQDVAAKKKRGCIVALTKEAIRGDKTGLLMKRAREGGYFEGLQLEKRVIDAIIDENGGAKSAINGGHRYFWKGTSYAGFQATTPWINIVTSAGLVDYTDIDAARRTLMNMTDPYTGEPIDIMPKHLIVTPQNVATALNILDATGMTRVTAGYATTGNPTETAGPNLVKAMGLNLTIVTSQMLAVRAATDTDWWLGDISRQVARFVNWDIEMEELGQGSEDAFKRDILFQVKASLKDAVSVLEPRAMVENQQ